MTLKINPSKICSKIESFIKQKTKDLLRSGVILGLSGGIDSCVVAKLCVNALGKEKVTALIMPERDSDKEQINDAREFAESLKINYKLIDLEPVLKEFGAYKFGKFPLNIFPTKMLKEKIAKKGFQYYKKKFGKTPFAAGLLGTDDKILSKSNAYYRIKHRMRMLTFYYHAELNNLLVVGAANKTEHLTGFFVKYGIDHSTDIMPIIHLYKTQVKQLAKHLKIPEKIIQKAPSPDMIPGIFDEYVFGLPYEKIDLILYNLEKKIPVKKIATSLKINIKSVEHIKELNKLSEHMRKGSYCL